MIQHGSFKLGKKCIFLFFNIKYKHFSNYFLVIQRNWKVTLQIFKN